MLKLRSHLQYNPRSIRKQFTPSYSINGNIIQKKPIVKDLGIIMSEDLKFHAQVDEACRRAHNEINRIRRTFMSRSPNFLAQMYKQFVRPHIEYCIEIWNPKYACDIDKLERVQNKMTRLIPNGRNMSHEARNQVMRLTSHHKRRLRGDLINIYKNYDNQELFKPRNSDRTRGHPKTLEIPRCQTLIRKHSFCSRSIEDWNNLPYHVVMSENLNAFKRNIDLVL